MIKTEERAMAWYQECKTESFFNEEELTGILHGTLYLCPFHLFAFHLFSRIKPVYTRYNIYLKVLFMYNVLELVTFHH